MTDETLRRRIAIEAARLMRHRQEANLGKARIRAARTVSGRWVKPGHLPSEAEIRDELERASYVRDGDARFDNLRDLRLAALEWMRQLADLSPRITGAARDGNVRSSNLIEIVLPTTARPEEELLSEFGDPEFEDRPDASIEEGTPQGRRTFEAELTFDDSPDAGISLEEYEELLAREYPDIDFNQASPQAETEHDRFQVYRMLLAPLEQVQQRADVHPEGDALYHSLQVYSLAADEVPYDEEFLLAALLHDVGKGIDPHDPVPAALQALSGYVTERTAWFIENLHVAHSLLDNTIGARAKRRLQSHPDYDELLTLARCNRRGRVCGAIVPSLDDVLQQIRELAFDHGA